MNIEDVVEVVEVVEGEAAVSDLSTDWWMTGGDWQALTVILNWNERKKQNKIEHSFNGNKMKTKFPEHAKS